MGYFLTLAIILMGVNGFSATTAGGIIISDSCAKEIKNLLIADTVQIYSEHDVLERMELNQRFGNKQLEAYYEEMGRRGGTRFIIKPRGLDALDPLYKMAPNFSKVIDDLKKSIALSIRGSEPIQFAPILLLGHPGTGKTHFANSLAKVLGTGYSYIPVGSTTAGWVLSGASSQWKDARPGMVQSQFVDGEYANPLFVLDEIDKAGEGKTYDPLGALYGLLEKDTAQKYKDEYAEVTLDASHALWVATANHKARIPDAILNRMNVYEITLPDAEGARLIAQNIYRGFLKEHPKWQFEPEPSEEVLDKLTQVYPRDVRKILEDAFGTAAVDKRHKLLAKDIDLTKGSSERPPIGF